MSKTKLFYPAALIVAAIFLLASCGTAKNSTKENSITNYTVKFVPNGQNEYEGNIIVTVLDSKGKELIGTKLFIYSENRQISELELTTTSMGVFYEKQKTLSIKATKVGYLDCETEIISMSTDKACFVELKLIKK